MACASNRDVREPAPITCRAHQSPFRKLSSRRTVRTHPSIGTTDNDNDDSNDNDNDSNDSADENQNADSGQTRSDMTAATIRGNSADGPRPPDNDQPEPRQAPR